MATWRKDCLPVLEPPADVRKVMNAVIVESAREATVDLGLVKRRQSTLRLTWSWMNLKVQGIVVLAVVTRVPRVVGELFEGSTSSVPQLPSAVMIQSQDASPDPERRYRSRPGDMEQVMIQSHGTGLHPEPRILGTNRLHQPLGSPTGFTPASTYASEFRQLAFDVPWGDAALKDQFRFGLRGDVKDLLLTMPDPATLPEAITQALQPTQSYHPAAIKDDPMHIDTMNFKRLTEGEKQRHH
ncbi:hypothetical protein BDK51DRAFT_39730 [Blyttiomyces helicus]|uniref:Uncharacterized protein n=1 Tax=Blyttiomyces helicus TaxID=388810 RepID=A0A4P9VY94_9FUNG|nr:hypothetical protein BDK51DRAFT_39730 [Blyttiomyces helicus]|eukprot:RKO83268.1 hypothetical protein BDK51DRAFT_39730 [Blyttiomyces helicus]